MLKEICDWVQLRSAMNVDDHKPSREGDFLVMIKTSSLACTTPWIRSLDESSCCSTIKMNVCGMLVCGEALTRKECTA